MFTSCNDNSKRIKNIEYDSNLMSLYYDVRQKHSFIEFTKETNLKYGTILKIIVKRKLFDNPKVKEITNIKILDFNDNILENKKLEENENSIEFKVYQDIKIVPVIIERDFKKGIIISNDIFKKFDYRLIINNPYDSRTTIVLNKEEVYTNLPKTESYILLIPNIKSVEFLNYSKLYINNEEVDFENSNSGYILNLENMETIINENLKYEPTLLRLNFIISGEKYKQLDSFIKISFTKTN